jgi:hypothetical protein
MVLLPRWYVERVKPDGVPALNPKMVRQFLAKITVSVTDIDNGG